MASLGSSSGSSQTQIAVHRLLAGRDHALASGLGDLDRVEIGNKIRLVFNSGKQQLVVLVVVVVDVVSKLLLWLCRKGSRRRNQDQQPYGKFTHWHSHCTRSFCCCCCCCNPVGHHHSGDTDCCPRMHSSIGGSMSSGSGGSSSGGSSDGQHVLLMILLVVAIVLAVIGFFVGFVIVVIAAQRIVGRHIYLLQKRQLVHEFQVMDLQSYDLDQPLSPAVEEQANVVGSGIQMRKGVTRHPHPSAPAMPTEDVQYLTKLGLMDR
mmetsp:Transcript_18813/g.46699  ORF Transcript_18813/g.46699 Transcript_18813/m.46699 type:complete len:263 (-) Transcript_18813:143-931(-)